MGAVLIGKVLGSPGAVCLPARVLQQGSSAGCQRAGNCTRRDMQFSYGVTPKRAVVRAVNNGHLSRESWGFLDYFIPAQKGMIGWRAAQDSCCPCTPDLTVLRSCVRFLVSLVV